ncbi:NAD(P)/FAD-dependent oxidoreductase [Rhizobium sp. BE258]|uniref:FAD/NAD(P)-dependent oxidoreductase n=1 Tax=Rhizobium sp. BE258 TaxID=2817722 RepID=UPI00286733C3|nr:NAD(P)/FAD-dependent oxidoreductase [Rhizobium sp. BE258]MDR7145147.1 NADPH-dependent 2,4-dienoyl-CoA reductase/sulfur reductase-like enzyme [Rhizobium sp. BE258]
MTVVIIGAGPAGMAAAATLAQAGLRPIVIDEGAAPGGQIFRRPQPELARSAGQLYGFDAARATAFNDAFAALGTAIDYRPRSQVWAVSEGRLYLASKDGASTQPWTHLIVAPGAMDRIMPLKGWTTPGVSSLGGAQISLKAEAAAIGRRVVFAGSGPLLYLVAYQYAKAGVSVGGVLETGRPFAQLSALPDLMSGGKAFARGLFYMAALRGRGIPLMTGVKLGEVLRKPDGQVSGVTYRWRGRERIAACDALAVGHGLKAETQIADLLGLDFVFNEVQRQWLPVTDEDGRSSVANIYLAGDGLSIRGSEIAEASGRLAAGALLRDIGRAAPLSADRDRLSIKKASAFRQALDRTFPFPVSDVAKLPDDVLVCRCEGVTAGTIRQTVAASSEVEINRIKAFCRVGMGRCQGRLCAAAASELVAAAAGTDLQSVGRMRGQAPIKPVLLADIVRSQS